MWIAKNKNDDTCMLFASKPERNHEHWISRDKSKELCSLPSDVFPDMTWDNEPKKVFLNAGFDFALQINHVTAMLKCTQDELIKVRGENAVLFEKLKTIKEIIEH